MNTQEVANRLVELCRMGEYTKAQEELYDDNCASIEPEGTGFASVQGIDAIKQKAEQWANMVQEVHSGEVSDPLVADNFFTVSMKNDVTFKEMGRMQMEELCVYKVNNGKVVSEQFFFTPQG